MGMLPIDPADRLLAQWLVRSGDNEVGPVSLELIARGLNLGKVPQNAEVSLLSTGIWRPVYEVITPLIPRPLPAPKPPTIPPPTTFECAATDDWPRATLRDIA